MSIMESQLEAMRGAQMAGSELPAGNERAASADPTDPDDFASRVRAWYLEAVGHAFWKDFTEQGEEDMAFYVGGKGQWGHKGSYADYDKLIAQKRAVFSINHIQSIVDIMSGYYRANAMDIKADPQGDGDVESAQLMTWFLKYAQNATNTGDILAEMFEDGNIRGMDCAEFGIDYSGEKPVNGEISVNRLTPGIGKDLVWDPYFLKYDLSDCRYILRYKWAFLLDLIAEYPEHEDELREAVSRLRTVYSENRTAAKRGDNYGFVRNHPIENLEDEQHFYHPPDDRLLIIEAYYHIYFSKYAVFDRATGKITNCDTYAEAQALRESDKENLRIHRTETRRVRMGTVIPATYTTIEEDKNPYPNDDSNYPIVPYIAKRKGDTVYGVVRNLKDPQRIENKRWSQVADVLAKWATIRPLIVKGSLVTPEDFNDASVDKPIIYNKEEGPPSWFVAPIGPISNMLEVLAKEMKLNMREISGINTDLLGQKHDTSSGVAIARRQQQGQVIATVFFDNAKKTRRLAGQRLARRIQQVYTADDVMRVTNDYGASVLVRINPMNASGSKMSDEEFHQFVQTQAAAGKPHVLRDVTSLKYEIVVSEAPTTPTARAAALMSLLEIAEKVPAIAPALLDFIVELSDVPNRQELMQRVRRLIPPQILGEAPPPTGGVPPNPAAQAEGGGSPPGLPPGPPAATGGGPPMAPAA